ncbi:calcium-binding protein [Haematospirillum sp. H1815]|uniref:M10 family metallopeptidase C-terminal domain-containing protein n=1 Tax=Haematospirillum sp. H1815 TaxID=2723108 RepID=UPI00143B3370|nr:M10 family metallopeptidase C-terminal domain-containing protein [Haematospirillum sp. H1815]NKD76286.1 calcium-binding protein [Haematospirillum sp. H1815]
MTRRVEQDSFLGNSAVFRVSECFFPTKRLVAGDNTHALPSEAPTPRIGSSGDDTIRAEPGPELIDGLDGTDLVDYSEHESSELVQLPSVVPTTETDVQIPDQEESLVADRSGNSEANLFIDAPAHEVIDGHGGVDVVDYSRSSAGIRVTLAGENDAYVYADGICQDVLRNIEGVVGTSLADELRGDDGVNVLIGNGGDDLIEGAGQGDLLMGGGGADIFVYRHLSDSSPQYQDFIADLNSLSGDRIDLSDFDGNVMREGFQPLAFSGDVPRVHSIWYQDDMDAGWGAGKVVADVNGDLQPDITIGVWEMSARQGKINVVLRHEILGTDGDDMLAATPGRDLVDGLAGFDVLDLSESKKSLYIALSGSQDSTVFADGLLDDLVRNIEGIKSGSGNDVIKGDSLNNVIVGGAGDDILFGGEGQDILTGGSGSDRFVYNASLDGGDTILDFSIAEGDALDFGLTLAASLLHFSTDGPEAHAVWCVPGSPGNPALVLADINGDAAPDFTVTLLGLFSEEAPKVLLPGSSDATAALTPPAHKPHGSGNVNSVEESEVPVSTKDPVTEPAPVEDFITGSAPLSVVGVSPSGGHISSDVELFS